MTLSDQWEELEAALPADREGRMVRRIHPRAPGDLRITAARDGRRGLELEIGSGAVEGIDPPVGTRAVDALLEPRASGRVALALELTDPAAADLFASLCGDVAAATAATATEGAAVEAWLGRFSRWRRLLERGAGGLSAARQRGLYGELWAVRSFLAPSLGVAEAVAGWKGPEGAPRDFEVGGVGIEVKTSAANEPQVVPVNGERQLDETELDVLFLTHLSLEVLRDAGETLPAAVASVRGLAADGPAAGPLEDRLLDSGYSDAHTRLYGRTGYALRRLSVMEVGDGFPRITERGLPDGVGRVHYSLAIDACRDFEVDGDALTQSLSGHGH